jgi:hypothetical protein
MDPKEVLKQLIRNEDAKKVDYGFSDQYLVLDTYCKNQSSDIQNGIFIFDIATQGSTTFKAVGTKERLENIVEIQVSDFYFPILPLRTVDITSASPLPTSPDYRYSFKYDPAIMPAYNSLTQLAPTQEFTMEIQEIGLQSYSDLNGKRHHFRFSLTNEIKTTQVSSVIDADISPATITSNLLKASPSEGWDRYYFTDPIISLSTITLSFRHDYSVGFYPDVYYNVPATFALSSAADTAIGAPPPTTYYYLVFSIPTNNLAPQSTAPLSANDMVVITGLSCPNTYINATVNNPNGNYVGPPFVLTDGTAASDVLFLSPIIYIPPGRYADVNYQKTWYVTVYVPKRRMQIPLRVRKMTPRVTNHGVFTV